MREKTPDKQEAISLIESAKKDMDFTFTIKISDASANTIIRNVYECFRMLGEALLIKQGIVGTDHIAMINELLKIEIETKDSLYNLDNLRRLRHNINYYAYRATREEAEIIFNFSKNNFYSVYQKVKEILNA